MNFNWIDNSPYYKNTLKFSTSYGTSYGNRVQATKWSRKKSNAPGKKWSEKFVTLEDKDKEKLIIQ